MNEVGCSAKTRCVHDRMSDSGGRNDMRAGDRGESVAVRELKSKETRVYESRLVRGREGKNWP